MVKKLGQHGREMRTTLSVNDRELTIVDGRELTVVEFTNTIGLQTN